MAEHMWVMVQYAPVEVEVLEDGSVDVHTTDMADILAREDSAIGCWICEEQLTSANVHSECPGAPD